MDVYLVPAGADRYELYCETPPPEPDDSPAGAMADRRPGEPASFRTRLRRRWVALRDRLSATFSRAVAEGEEHRLGITSDRAPSRVRRFITRKLADAVAEQRLLWYLRRQDAARLVHPDDMPSPAAIAASRRLLKSDYDKHQRWLIIDGLLVIGAAPFGLLPGPNVLAYYFIFRTVGHYLSMKGAARGLSSLTWMPVPSPHLTELRRVIGMDASARDGHLGRISGALGLDRLDLFVERVVDRPRDLRCILAPAVTLAELAVRLGCRLDGDGSVEVLRVASLDEAGPGDLTFLANSKYAARLPQTRASAVIVSEAQTGAPCAMLRTSQPYLAFAEAVAVLSPPRRPAPGISPQASISPDAELGPDVAVGAFVCVGPGARIGARTILEPHVVVGAHAVIGPDCLIRAHASIRDGVVLGARVVIHDATVIGSDGFGFARRPDGSHQKIPQIGRVLIEDDVEIGAHSAIDRPAVGETRIGQGTKIDNLVQVAHGVRIGRNVLLAAQVGIAGSTVLEDDVIMAGQSGATGHVHLGHGARVGAKSAVTKDVADGEHVAGIPAGDVGDWREAVVLVRRLPEMRRGLNDLESRLAALESRLK